VTSISLRRKFLVALRLGLGGRRGVRLDRLDFSHGRRLDLGGSLVRLLRRDDSLYRGH
jgi:hypothetical protein